jgi:hypothetical protein
LAVDDVAAILAVDTVASILAVDIAVDPAEDDSSAGISVPDVNLPTTLVKY